MLKKKGSIVLHCVDRSSVRPSTHRLVHPFICPSFVFIIMASRRGSSTMLHSSFGLMVNEVKETCRAESVKGIIGHIGSCVVSLYTVRRDAARGGPLMGEG